MELTDRHQAILEAIVREHVKTASPVGSQVLVEKYGISLSPASIRNAMAELEAEGFLDQPHTSAGRVPTVKAYRYALANIFEEKADVSRREQTLVRKSIETHDEPVQRQKAVARTLADLSGTTVIFGYDAGDFSYTGIANLFHQPEFMQLNRILTLSALVDHLDEVAAGIFEDLPLGYSVLLGDENPFGQDTAALLAKWKERGGQRLFGMLGPMRMPYDHYLALLKFTANELENA